MPVCWVNMIQVIKIHNEDRSKYYEFFFFFSDVQLLKILCVYFQMYNFLRFCELVVKSKAPVKCIKLLTGQEDVSSII